MTGSPLFHTLVAATVCVACLGACGDDASDDTAIGVANLSSSACLDPTPANTVATDERCVISQRDDKKLALQVFGLRTLCLESEILEEVPWRAVAREDGGRVIVSVEWPSDKSPACGSCAYDFKVELGPYEWPERTDFKFEVRSCPSCNVDDSRSFMLGTAADERATQACGDEQLDAGSP